MCVQTYGKSYQSCRLPSRGLTVLAFSWLLCFCQATNNPIDEVWSLKKESSSHDVFHATRSITGRRAPSLASEDDISRAVRHPFLKVIYLEQNNYRAKGVNTWEPTPLYLSYKSEYSDADHRTKRNIKNEAVPDVNSVSGSETSVNSDGSPDPIEEFYQNVQSMTPEEADAAYMEAQTTLCWLMENLTYTSWLDDGQLYCNSTFDRVLCWPTTPAGEVALQPCPEEFAGVKYLNYGNASKTCYSNGSWELKTDYNQCHPEFGYQDPAIIHNHIVRWLYYVGFTLSIISCIIALFIFIKFPSLWCARNKIHCHLIVTFVLRNVIWLIMDNLFPRIIDDDENTGQQWICKTIVTLFNYAQVTNFFWMLVEGLYLHLMIVWAFSIERIKFWWYIVLGWGVPALIVIVWAIVKLQLRDNSCWLPEESNVSSDYEYIYIVPVLLVLLINVLFLISIVVVLITKLRASNTILTRQYKKAVKATVILLPLLGGTYILFICSPGEEKLVSNLIFIYFNTVLQSTQGLAVTTFYCFLNGEVRGTIRQRWQRWREGRSITTRYTRASIATNCETLRASFQQGNSMCNGQHCADGANTSTKNNNHRDTEGALIHVVKKPEESDEDSIV